VIDRCDRPYTLLSNIHKHLTKDSNNGILLLAVVFPLIPYVEGQNEVTEYIEVGFFSPINILKLHSFIILPFHLSILTP
jgi:hypothetical protein